MALEGRLGVLGCSEFNPHGSSPHGELGLPILGFETVLRIRNI
jgi:hypothetical protein